MRNRYGDFYDFEKVSENTYKIIGDLSYWRFGGIEGQSEIDMLNLSFCDPSGGPYLEINMKLPQGVIKRIFCKEDGIFFEVF
jgi:hypothetical protein